MILFLACRQGSSTERTSIWLFSLASFGLYIYVLRAQRLHFPPRSSRITIAQAASETREHEPASHKGSRDVVVRVVRAACVWMDHRADPKYIRAIQPSSLTSFSNPGDVRARSPALPVVQVSQFAPPSPPPNNLLHISAKRVTREPQELGAGGRGGLVKKAISFAPFGFPIFRGRPTASFIGSGG